MKQVQAPPTTEAQQQSTSDIVMHSKYVTEQYWITCIQPVAYLSAISLSSYGGRARVCFGISCAKWKISETAPWTQRYKRNTCPNKIQFLSGLPHSCTWQLCHCSSRTWLWTLASRETYCRMCNYMCTACVHTLHHCWTFLVITDVYYMRVHVYTTWHHLIFYMRQEHIRMDN